MGMRIGIRIGIRMGIGNGNEIVMMLRERERLISSLVEGT